MKYEDLFHEYTFHKLMVRENIDDDEKTTNFTMTNVCLHPYKNII